MIPTHSLGINGRSWMEFHTTAAGERDDFAQILRRVDGHKLYSLILWKLPEGKTLDQTDAFEDANEYMQCAGSTDRMTVEVRRIGGGRVEHYVVGHALNGSDLDRRETILWDSAETIVAPNEVFKAAEAAALFEAYYETGWVPSRYLLRPVSI